MISGVVNERLEAVVSLELRGPKGDVRMFDAIVDTGYDGYLTVAPRTVAELGLPLASTGRARLADGSVIGFGIHHGTVIWDGQALLIELDEARHLTSRRYGDAGWARSPPRSRRWWPRHHRTTGLSSTFGLWPIGPRSRPPRCRRPTSARSTLPWVRCLPSRDHIAGRVGFGWRSAISCRH